MGEEIKTEEKAPEIIEEKPLNDGKNIGVERNEKGQLLPGSILNPAGKPKGLRSFTTKVRDALEKIAEGKDYTYEEAFIKAILKKGIIDQDPQIIRLIWNYLDGLPRMPIDFNDETPRTENRLLDLLKDSDGPTKQQFGDLLKKLIPDNRTGEEVNGDIK